jgi:hypothetical protein
MNIYMGCSSATSICMWAVLVKGAYIFKKRFFKKINLVMAWKKKQVRGPNARYAYVEKFRVRAYAP